MKGKNARRTSMLRPLLWLGGGLVLLFGGVFVLWLAAPKPGPPADPERTLVWVYDTGDPAGPAWAILIEESRSRRSLYAVPFSVPADIRQIYATARARQARLSVAQSVDREIHHHLFIPSALLAQLVDKVGGVTVMGQVFGGEAALAYVREGGEYYGPWRAGLVLLALSESAASHSVPIGIREGLRLMNQMDTNFDPAAVPDILARWRGYPNPTVLSPGGSDLRALSHWLLPDPPKPDPSKP